jgi:hypothetical protein
MPGFADMNKEKGGDEKSQRNMEFPHVASVDLEKMGDHRTIKHEGHHSGDDDSSSSHSHMDLDQQHQKTAGPNGSSSGVSQLGPDISRTVSEVRDGIATQVEMQQDGGDGGDSSGDKAGRTMRQANDPNLVDWLGPDDPENPKNWKFSKKWAAVFVVSIFTLISPVSSSMVAPSLEAIGEELDIQDSFQQALVLSIFVLGYAVGPLL